MAQATVTRQSGDVLFFQTFHHMIGEHLHDVSENPDITTINELEFRLGTMINQEFTPKFRMPVFRRVISYLKERYVNQIGKAPMPFEELQLDVSFDARSPGLPEGLKKTRVRMTGTNAIGQFCRFNKIDMATAKVETKQKEQTTDMKEYSVRIQSSLETTLDKELSSRIANIISNPAITKYYRYKKRYSWIDGDIQWDLTVVKAASGKTFEASNVLRQQEFYEIELEYLPTLQIRTEPGIPVNPERMEQIRRQIDASIGPNLKDLLKVYNETFELVSNTEQEAVLAGYSDLIESRVEPYFIGMDLVALEVPQLLPDAKTGKMPIQNKLATPKADGKRNLLYVYNGPNRRMQGNLYLINNRMQVFGTGLTSDQLGDLFDTELVRLKNGKYAILLFDTLFHLGNDVRCTESKRSLISDCPPSTNKEANMGLVDRLKIIKEFVNMTTTTKVMKDVPPEIRGKEYFIRIAEKPEVIAPEHWPLVIPVASDIKSPLWPNEVILRRDWEYDLDGIVFTPIGPYPRAEAGKSRKWLENLKWKPADKLSNDFLVLIRKGSNGKDILYPAPKGTTNPEQIDNRQYKAVELYSFIQNKSKQKEFVKFNAAPPFKDGVHNMVMLPVEDDGTIRTTDEEHHIIYDNSVIEFTWSTPKDFDPTKENSGVVGEWKPIRFREDKTDLRSPNHLDTARNNWNLIVSPITEGMITGKTNIPRDYYTKVKYDIKSLTNNMRDFHNDIKRDMLQSAAAYVKKSVDPTEGIKLLDIGSGQGGDIHKWVGGDKKKPLINHVVGIEKNIGNIREAIVRYEKDYKNTPIRVIFFHADASRYLNNGDAGITTAERSTEPQRLQEFFLLPDHSQSWFDLISCQFALHYFTGDEAILTNLLTNVFQNLKDGGLFFGTTMVGSEVFALLKPLDKGQSVDGNMGQVKIWEITKQYDETVLLPVGQQISIMFSSISNQSMPEYLVNFDHFFKLARRYGLVPVSNVGKFKDFGKFADLYDQNTYKMSKDEKTYSFLNGYFILKKDQAVADETENVAFRADVQTRKDASKVKVDMPEPSLPNVPSPSVVSEEISAPVSTPAKEILKPKFVVKPRTAAPASSLNTGTGVSEGASTPTASETTSKKITAIKKK